MEIKKSQQHDLDRIMEIYDFAREFMAKTGNPNQWGPTNWPPKELISNDINTGNSYVCVNNNDEIIGTFVFIQGKTLNQHMLTLQKDPGLRNLPTG